MTLVELLVVVAIIGLLVAMLLPAVQAARESARVVQCKNNLRQIALAMLNYEAAQQEFPAGGWNRAWIGDPNLGSGPRQPGGWIFQTAPYLEQAPDAMPGVGVTSIALRDALAELAAVTIPVTYCPSRRAPGVYPAIDEDGLNFAPPVVAAKTDYAANAGSRAVVKGSSHGPWIALPGFNDCSRRFPNCRWVSSDEWLAALWNGIVGDHSGARVAQVTDGASRTLLVAEKWLLYEYYVNVSYDAPEDNAHNGFARDNPGDNGSMYIGFDWDNIRVGGSRALPRRDNQYQFGNPQVDKRGSHYVDRFGSPHVAGVVAARCDGSIDQVAFDIDPEVWTALVERNDAWR